MSQTTTTTTPMSDNNVPAYEIVFFAKRVQKIFVHHHIWQITLYTYIEIHIKEEEQEEERGGERRGTLLASNRQGIGSSLASTTLLLTSSRHYTTPRHVIITRFSPSLFTHLQHGFESGGSLQIKYCHTHTHVNNTLSSALHSLSKLTNNRCYGIFIIHSGHRTFLFVFFWVLVLQRI